MEEVIVNEAAVLPPCRCGIELRRVRILKSHPTPRVRVPAVVWCAADGVSWCRGAQRTRENRRRQKRCHIEPCTQTRHPFPCTSSPRKHQATVLRTVVPLVSRAHKKLFPAHSILPRAITHDARTRYTSRRSPPTVSIRPSGPACIRTSRAHVIRTSGTHLPLTT